MKVLAYVFHNFSKILAILTFFLILAGYIDLKSQYIVFGINVENYITASEILLNSIDNIIFGTIIAVIAFSITLGLWSQILKYRSLYMVLFAASMAALLFFSDLFYSKVDSSGINYLIAFLVANIYFAIAAYLVQSMEKATKDEANGENDAILWWLSKFLGMIIISVTLFNVSRSTKLIFGKANQSETVLFFDPGDRVIINSELVIIGKTHDYLFTYDKVNSRTLIYSLKNLVKIERRLDFKSFSNDKVDF
jgi:hypothetical protein